MNDDFSEVINKFSDILKDKNIDLSNLAGDSISPANNPTSDSDSSFNNNSSNASDFNIDVNTILKIKDIISKMNKNQNCPRNQLLHSLKPYLEDDKQEKLEQYIKIANLLSVMENLDMGINFFKENEKGYDFILIITLFLLIF